MTSYLSRDGVIELASYVNEYAIKPLLDMYNLTEEEIQQSWYRRTQRLVSKNEIVLVYEPGDWEYVYNRLSKRYRPDTLDSITISSAIPIEAGSRDPASGSLLVSVLLQLVQRINSEQVLEAAIRSESSAILSVLLKDSRVNPSASNNRALMLSVRGYPDIIELLLRDDRVASTLSIEQKRELASSLIRRLSLTQAIKFRYKEIARLLLATGQVVTKNDLIAAVEYDDAEMVSLLLPFLEIEDSAEWLFPYLVKRSVDVALLFLRRRSFDEAFASSLLLEAAIEGNTSLVNLLLEHGRTNPNLALVELAAQPELVKRRLAIYDSLLRDPRTDVRMLTMTRELALALETLLWSRVLGSYRASTVSVSTYEEVEGADAYTRFLYTLILKRLTKQEAIKWLIEHPSRESVGAARDILESTTAIGPFETAYLGYFLHIVHGFTIDQVRVMLLEEGHYDLGVELACGLIGAQVGASEYNLATYDAAARDIFRIE